MSVKRNLFIKFLNGELLEINYYPEDDLHMICKHIVDCKPELYPYDLILFHLNEEENGTNRIRDFHQLLNGSMIGIYVRKKPHVEIVFVEPVSFYNINTIDFDGYSYKGEIQKYKAMFYMDDDSRHDFIFYYDKYSNKFAYDTELHSLDVVEFNDRGRACMEGYCKWFSLGDMITTNRTMFPSQLIEYAPLFDKEWNTNLLYFARV